jgi:hypothetical protein
MNRKEGLRGPGPFPGSSECFVDVLQIAPGDATSVGVRAQAVHAAAFLASHSWWPGLERMYFAVGLPPLACCFLVHLRSPVGDEADEWLWVVSGDVPAAWFVSDRVREPIDALRVYVELAASWLRAAPRDVRAGQVFPFRSARTAAARSQLAANLATIERALAGPLPRSREAGWVDAAQCARLRSGPVMRSGESGLVSGMLVLDHRGAPGILLGLAPRPAPAWLAVQRDRRVRELASGVWWKIAPLSGGSVYVPLALITRIGAPDDEQVAEAMRNANEFGKRGLREAIAKGRSV